MKSIFPPDAVLIVVILALTSNSADSPADNSRNVYRVSYGAVGFLNRPDEAGLCNPR